MDVYGQVHNGIDVCGEKLFNLYITIHNRHADWRLRYNRRWTDGLQPGDETIANEPDCSYDESNR